MTQDHILNSKGGQDLCRNFTGICATVFVRAILSSQSNSLDRANQLFDRMKMWKRRGEYSYDVLYSFILIHINNLGSELLTFVKGHVHLPVTGNDFLSHVGIKICGV